MTIRHSSLNRWAEKTQAKYDPLTTPHPHLHAGALQQIAESIQHMAQAIDQLRRGKPIIMPRRTGKTTLQKYAKATNER